MASASSNNGKKSNSDAVVSLLSRPWDLFFVLWFFNFWFSVMFTDIHNFTASVLGMEVHEMEGRVDMVWPPRFLTKLYFAWARTVDPLLYQNPIWWQVIEWINILCLMPTSLYALHGFIFGNNRIRLPVIITSSFTWYSLMLCIGCTLYGDSPSPDVPMFLAIYVPYALFPMYSIYRLWDERPFSASTLNARKSACKSFLDVIVRLAMIVTYAFYFYYIYLWFVKHPEVFAADAPAAAAAGKAEL
eukprot:TRINITY_DN53523_c0_g1_i2.p2 TRINITY_DN53523_c0_g1~~TRINITY_DN53523_c0_g1_i2.p2  ORF type:complete len:245 (+),score=123.78 TRINITY_DN53523_c0_g1_i2:200-934(+)